MTPSQFTTTGNHPGILYFLARTRRWIRLIGRIPKTGSDAFLMILASVLINILALALPVALMQIYDRIIPNSSYSTLTWLIVGVLCAVCLETTLKICRSFVSNWLSARLEHILNTEVLNYFLGARLDRYEQDKAGVHFERFNAVGIIKTYISGQILLVMLDIPFAVIFLWLLYYIGGPLCFFTMGVLAVFIVVCYLSKLRFETYNEKQVDLNKEHLDFILEILGGIHTVKSLSMEERMFRKFENIQARVAETGFQSNGWKYLPQNSTPFFSQFNMLGIIFLGADLVISGEITVGAMTACTMLATRSLQPVTKLAGFWLRFSEVTIAQKQLDHIIRLQSVEDRDVDENVPRIKDIEGEVMFDAFAIHQRDLDIEIEEFDAVIPAGEVVGVTGGNPELTTALMLSVCGMYKPSSGSVFVDEFMISAMDHSYFGGRVAYLPKRGRLFNGTILDNIAMFDPNKRQVALDTAAMLELDQFVSDLPNGYETPVDQRANNSLPLGLIQRTCLARVLVTCPRILIVDRTLNSMDQETYDLVCDILNNLKGRITLFIVADHGAFPFPPNRIIECSTGGILMRKGPGEGTGRGDENNSGGPSYG